MFRYFFGVGELSGFNLLMAAIIMTILSVLSYYFIEQTTRHNKMSFAKNLILFYVLPSTVILAMSFKMRLNKNSEMAYPSDCHDKVEGNHCTLGDMSVIGNTKILFVGDSFAGHISPFIDTLGKNQGWKADLLSSDSCPCLIGFDSSKNLSAEATRRNCIRLNELFSKIYNNYDVIVFSENFEDRVKLYTNYISAKEETIKYLLQNNKKVYFLRTSTNFGVNFPKNKILKETLGLELPVNLDKVNEAKVNWKKMEQMLNKYPSVIKIDMVKYIPRDGIIGENVIFADGGHFSIYGARKIAEIFIKQKVNFINKEELK